MTTPIKVPPIKIQGIKTKLVKWIENSLTWNGNGVWIEPFTGSGVVGFNIKPKNALFCDTNPHIIKFYDDLNHGKILPKQVKSYLEFEGEKLSMKGADYYYEVRDRFNKNHSSLDFLFLNRSCFNGVVRFNKKGKFNVPFGHKDKRFSKSYITKIFNQVDNIFKLMQSNNWIFSCQNFTETLSHVSDCDFVYCDPPYVGRHVDYYDSWNEDLEIELFNILKDIPARFILSTWHSNKYRKNNFIESNWSNFNVATKEHFYYIGGKEANRNTMIEALVYNYEINSFSERNSNSLNENQFTLDFTT